MLGIFSIMKSDINTVLEHGHSPNATVVGMPGRIMEIRNHDTDTAEKLPDTVWGKIQLLESIPAELEKICVKITNIRELGATNENTKYT